MKRQIAFIMVFSFGVCLAGTNDEQENSFLSVSPPQASSSAKPITGTNDSPFTQFALRQYNHSHSHCMEALYSSQYQKSGAKDLSIAIVCGCYEEASQLISAKNVNEQDSLGRTPLMWLASRWWHSSPIDREKIKHLTKIMLEDGVDIKITDKWHNTIFDIAWKEDSHEFVDFLLQECAKLQQEKRFNAYENSLQANEEEKNLPNDISAILSRDAEKGHLLVGRCQPELTEAEQKQPTIVEVDEGGRLWLTYGQFVKTDGLYVDTDFECSGEIDKLAYNISVSRGASALQDDCLTEQAFASLINTIIHSDYDHAIKLIDQTKFEQTNEAQKNIVRKLFKNIMQKCDQDIVHVQLEEIASQMPYSSFAVFLKKLLGECSICFEPLYEDEVKELGCCNQLLHQECMKQWNKNCPLCRTEQK